MKTFFILWVLPFFINPVLNTLPEPKKLALIIAVGKYPEGGRWKNLSSENDLKYIKAALQKNGFAEKDIDTLKNSDATKARILKQLDELNKRASEGDIVYFQFSGHGQQIFDDNNDEADGYDEAFIPYDAKANYDPVTYTGQNHLRDDEVGEKLAQIRQTIGSKGSLVVVIDACHSGTATRGNEFAICRGEPTPFQKPGYVPKNTINFEDLARQEAGMFESGKDAANMIVFSASSPNQVNYETKDQNSEGVGSLSYAFAKALSDLKEGSDYNFLFQKVKAQIQANYPMQIPMIEGNKSQEIFSGKFVPKQDIITVQKWFNDSTFSVNVGLLNSLQPGSTVKLFKLNTTEPIATGYIKNVSTFQSICVADKALNKSEAYEVKLEAVNNGAFTASLFIKKSDKSATGLEKQINSLVKHYSFLSLNDNADFMLDIANKDGKAYSLSLIEKGDSIRWTKDIKKGDTITGADFKELLDDIKKAMRIKYFRTMSDGGALSADVSVEIIPRHKSADSNDIRMKPLDLFDIKITNNGTQTLYYTIIDLMPDNEVKVLLPADGEEPQDRAIRPKSSFIIPEVEVDANTPRGKEFFKAIFTKTPMDLRNIFARKQTRSTRSNFLSFEEVVDDMYKETSGLSKTRSNITNVKVDEVGIITRGFTIYSK
jgi:hypothetical protein